MAVFVAQRSPGARADGRWRNRGGAAGLDAAVRNTPGMPQLDGNTPVFSVDAGGDLFPCGNLFRTVQPWRTRVAFSLSGNLGRFGNNQAGAGALAVVLAHQRGGNIPWLNAAQTR